MATTKLATGNRTAAAKQQVGTPNPHEIGFESGSGNVFADMGVPDADERLAKAELARIVRMLARARIAKGWTQSRVARELGITAPDMSDLMRGKLTRFSRERLELFPVRLGMAVHIQVSPPHLNDRASLTVELVESIA